ncbi:Serine/threonine protein kinase, partial [Streptoalloteichus tenebrarius]
MSAEGRLVAGRYRLLQRLGSGAMGVVWQAHDERLHRTVAVKELLLQPGLSREEADEAKQRAMREGRIAARLQHPNAVTVFDVVEEDGAPCLVMEYLASRSLAAVMAERGTLPPAEAARIGAQVAAALSAAHAAGIVHRDIKPGNILLAEDGTVKITDFGISRATGDVTVTKTGMLAGTPAYLAPEVARGRDIGPPSDVFSLGSTLYAAVEGEPPFGLNENTLALLHAVAAGKVNPPSQAGPLTALLMRLLRSEPDERPTMAQAREALAAVAAGKPLPAGLGETVAVVPPWQSGGVTQAVATKAVAAP